MEHVKYLIHYSRNKEDYESIMKDGYLKFIPDKCTMYCEGIYTQAVFDNMPFRGFASPYPIYIDKSILHNRKDYIIKKRRDPPITKEYPKEHFGFYGGDIVYSRSEYKNINYANNKLQNVLEDLTMTNEVILKNPISIKKYMIKNPDPFVLYSFK
jgi:hypothetical protein